MNVLIVENESKTILDLKTILGNLGHTVIAVASSGKDGVKKTDDLNPDLILINIKLNGKMNGVKAANKIRDSHRIPSYS